jgi:ABC-2 type transport system permease protein
VIEFPKGYGDSDTTRTGNEPAYSFPVYYNETNMSASQLGLTVMNATIDEWSKKATNYTPIVEIESKGIRALDIGYIDFLVTGIVAMMIMSNNMNGVAGQISAWRERGILRRMQGTRLKASTFIAAQKRPFPIKNEKHSLYIL